MVGVVVGLRVGVVVVKRVGRAVSKLVGCDCVSSCRRGDLFLSVRACASSTVVLARYRSSDFGLEARLSGVFSLDWGMAGKLLAKLECKFVSKMDDDGACENCCAWTGSNKCASVIARTSADVVLCCACNSDSCLV